MNAIAVIVKLPPNCTEVLVRGVCTPDEAVPVEVDVKMLANDRVWTPIDLRGGEFEVRDQHG